MFSEENDIQFIRYIEPKYFVIIKTIPPSNNQDRIPLIDLTQTHNFDLNESIIEVDSENDLDNEIHELSSKCFEKKEYNFLKFKI